MGHRQRSRELAMAEQEQLQVNSFKVRVYDVGFAGRFTQADAYQDHKFDSDQSLEEFVKGLIKDGFRVRNKWIMPGAIVWVEQL
jgi:hypothetical protein